MAITGHQIGAELCKALSLPKNTVGFTLRCYAGQFVTVECEYVPDGDIVHAFAEYGLVPRVKERAAELYDYDTWQRERNERAHREFMERTSRRLPSDFTTEEIARYFGVPLAS